jgi:hypothetical protein
VESNLPDFNLDLPEISYRTPENSDAVFIESDINSQERPAGESLSTGHRIDSDPLLLEKSKTAISTDWILGVLIFSFVILAWIRLFYNKFLSPTFVAAFSQQVSHNLYQDKSSVSFRVSSGLNLIFYLNGGLFVYLLMQLWGKALWGQDGFFLFGVLFFLLIGLYLAKQLLSLLVGVISQTQKVFSEYMHNVFLFNKNLGLIFFPVILGMVYMSDRIFPVFLYAGIACICVAFLFRIFRGFQIFIKEGVSILYWILYLCALEILPILLFLKLSGLMVW